MAIVTLSNLKKSFGNLDLFEDVSFFVNEKERVALIGANGTGKTTLLRIIYGELAPDDGSVSIEPGATLGYLPQEVDLPGTVALQLAVIGVTPQLLACASELADLQRKIASAGDSHANGLGAHYAEVSHQFDSLGGFDYQVRGRAILLGLGFDESEFDKPVQELSGGQKTRAALARLLLLSPDFLLLDEPTNHLDIQACEWLQTFLQTRYQGAALVVSHDRYFMDKVVDRIVEIDSGTAMVYKGNYSEFAHQKAALIEERRKLFKLQQKEIARLESAIQTLFSHRKFSRRDSKLKQLERLQQVSRVSDKQSIKADLAAAVRSGREVIRFSSLAKSYPGKQLFSDVEFVVERGRKIGVVGPNGSGKTTLLKIIAGRESADSGEVIFGHNVKPVYFAQEFDHLVQDRSVLEELCADAELTSKEARDLLARFLFLGDDAFKPVSVLSGGELCRLALAKVLATGPNLLLLDEPTNHLDIASREALEDALRAFNGTVLVASHDRYLLDAVTDQIVEISGGGFSAYLGNYSRYRDKLIDQEAARLSQAETRPSKDAPAPSARPLSTLRQVEKELRDLGKRQRELEHTIHQTEKRMAELTSALGDEENYRSGAARDLTLEYEQLNARLESLCAEWEQVSERIVEVEGAEVG